MFYKDAFRLIGNYDEEYQHYRVMETLERPEEADEYSEIADVIESLMKPAHSVLHNLPPTQKERKGKTKKMAKRLEGRLAIKVS